MRKAEGLLSVQVHNTPLGWIGVVLSDGTEAYRSQHCDDAEEAFSKAMRHYDDEADEEQGCITCSGTGMGIYESTTCPDCGGTGVESDDEDA
jgi:hypothetical protein